jgi:hypothetical protein
MIEPEDSFTGRWRLNPQASRVSPAITSWMQEIAVDGDAISVREEIIRSDGGVTRLSVEARFDGVEYPVLGSPVVDAIAYSRPDRCKIVGVGTKGGVVVLTETVTADPEAGRMTLDYRIHDEGRIVSSGRACFDLAERG